MTVRKMSFVVAAIIGAVLVFYIAVAGLLTNATESILVLFVAVLYGIFLRHTGLWFSKVLPVSTTVGVAISTVVQLLVAAALAFFCAGQVVKQVEKSISTLDESRQYVRESLNELPRLREFLASEPAVVKLLKLDESGQTNENRSKAQSEDESDSDEESSPQDTSSTSIGAKLAQGASNTAKQAVTATFGVIANILIVFFVGLYLALDPALYRRGFLKLLPERSRPAAGDVFGQLDHTLWNWLLGRFATMAITGVGVGIVLWLIGLPMPVTLAVVTGLLTFVPNIGPIIALALALLVALPLGMQTVIFTVVGYVLFQLLESYVLTPMIQKQQIAMPPAIILIAQLLFGVVAGFLGIAVATPLVAVAMVVVGVLYIENHLGERRTLDDCPGA